MIRDTYFNLTKFLLSDECDYSISICLMCSENRTGSQTSFIATSFITIEKKKVLETYKSASILSVCSACYGSVC